MGRGRGRAQKTWLFIFLAVISLTPACTEPVDFPHCVSEPNTDFAPLPDTPTYHGHIRAILDGRCNSCHSPDNIGPMVLTTYQDAYDWRNAVLANVISNKMPPWLPADCCNHFQDDISLTPRQIALIERWVDVGAPEGDPSNPGPDLPVVGGLSRVDLELTMDAPYLPEPPPRHLDDFRCFVMDWPLDEPVFVTGINPKPGARAVLHHLVIAFASGADAEAYEDMPPAQDGKPGFPCDGGLGDIPVTGILGGSLVGGDFPPGLGTRIEGDSKIILNVHYSASHAPPSEDLTTIEFKVDPIDTEGISDFEAIPMANPAWLIGDAMLVEAGAEDVPYAYQYDPLLFTRGDTVLLQGATPHMHYLGSSILMGIVHANGSRTCLLDIPDWDFGWEQPFWFAEPIELAPGDELFIKCTFSNTAERQPFVQGVPLEPRDIAWGSDNQDMCAGFLTFTRP